MASGTRSPLACQLVRLLRTSLGSAPPRLSRLPPTRPYLSPPRPLQSLQSFSFPSSDWLITLSHPRLSLSSRLKIPAHDIATMSVPRSRSVPHITLQTTNLSTASSSSQPAERHARPHLPRHRSAVALSSSSHHLVPVYTPRVEREDPFSLSGFFPANFAALEHPEAEQEWDWLRVTDDSDAGDDDHRSGRVSPISESDDEWTVPTPCSPDVEDALTGDAIKREDKLGILTLSGKSRPRLLRDVRAGRPHARCSRWASPRASPCRHVVHAAARRRTLCRGTPVIALHTGR